MRRLSIVVVLSVFALAACAAGAVNSSTTEASDDPSETTATADNPATTESADPTTGSEATTTTAVETTETTSGRPMAPDFTLGLGDGSAYTLSAGSKPVYLVFWAEW